MLITIIFVNTLVICKLVQIVQIKNKIKNICPTLGVV